ncbi:MAG: hypothetical protein WCE64_07165, partial [Bacteroidales bacterium]
MLKGKSFFRSGLSAFMKVLAGVNLISSPSFAGSELRTSFMHDGLKRTYIVHIPSSYDKSV